MERWREKMKGKKKLVFGMAFVLALLFFAFSAFSGEKDQYQEDVDEFFESKMAEMREIGETHRLSKGIYSVTVNYEASSTNHTVTAKSEEKPYAVKCDAICLERGKTQETFTVWIEEAVDDFQIKINYLGVGNIRISQLTVEEQLIGRVNRFFCDLLLLLVAATFLLACFYWRVLKDALDWRVVFCLTLIILFSLIPLFRSQIYIGDDSDFHFRRIEGICQGLKSGQFPVRMQPNWLHGYGYAVSIMYGEILLYFPALLRLLGFSIQEAYRAFAIGIGIGTSIVAYYSFKKIFDDKWIALTGCALYVLAPYHLVNFYTRAAVGEFTAMLFLPFIAMGFWSVLCDDPQKKKMWPFIVGFTGLLQSHLISCEMVGIFAILFCLIFIKKVLQRNNFMLLTKSALLVLTLNMWFLVPFLEYMWKEPLKVNTGLRTKGLMIQHGGKTIKDLVVPFTSAIGKTVPAPLGLGLLFALILLCISLIKYKGEKIERKAGIFVLASSLLALGMVTRYWPYDELVRRGFNLMGVIQFPWRFSAIAAIMIAIGGCFALKVIKRHREKAVYIGMSLLVGGTVLSSGYLLGTYMQYGNFLYCFEIEEDYYNIAGAEYLPVDVTYNDGSFHPLEPQAEQMDILAYEKKYNQITVTCRNLLDQENVVNVPILLYRGYKAYDEDTKEVFSMARADTGMTAVFLPALYEGTFTMRFCEPILWRAAEAVSLITFFLLIFWKKSLSLLMSRNKNQVL